ncbi:acetyl-CoA C-acyltransferase [Robbsia sp. Bb-Pol-6]|uniref:Acetyl-CoA C-acyltransferase n=1 Tax=Robbsia betulipollinis TaxID=2981849 RepID=A0ABT3ZL71_9BURK|nr:acetyl-CoA C-acyltransferase [Robbsia betulipollinis]MCY0387015.1 acetyl-CoA C-acyltransferase [Robbsia betulipollinis]
MADTDLIVLGWARSAIAPVGGALAGCVPHELGAPVVRALLARCGVRADQVDALVAGNALGAGGNPARMVALAAGLPDGCAALSVDTQCCAGLDAVGMAAGLLATGGASVVVAGGVEAWSRAPLRLHRPLRPDDAPLPYARPAFAPDPARDPDLLAAAADYACAHRLARRRQDAFAMLSHARTLDARAALAGEIVPVAGLCADSYARRLDETRVARLPLATAQARAAGRGQGGAPAASDYGQSRLAVAPQADGAAFVVLTTRAAARQAGWCARAMWRGGVALGVAPEQPMLAAEAAARRLLQRHGRRIGDLAVLELHDAFAAQALAFADAFGIAPERLNRRGGGLGRGHPIGASGAVSLVRLLADLDRDEAPGALGLVAVAGAGGIGSAALLERV